MEKKDCISIEAWLALNNPDVIAFQETLNGDDCTRNGYVEIHQVNKSYPNRSLAIFIRENIRILESGRVGTDNLFSQFVRVHLPGVGGVLVVNVYLPNGPLRDGTLMADLARQLFLDIGELVERCKASGDLVVVLGDFNTHNERFGGLNTGHKCRRDLENDFMDNLGLHAMPLYEHTWRRGTRMSFIDHVMISHIPTVHEIHIGECLNGVGPRQYPDHRPVSLLLSGTQSDFVPADFRRYDWRRATEDQ